MPAKVWLWDGEKKVRGNLHRNAKKLNIITDNIYIFCYC